METGFPRGTKDPRYYAECNAGLENRILSNPDKAYVYKDPNLCEQIPQVIAKGIKIDHVLVPVRDIEQAALSREHNGSGHGGVLENDPDQLKVLTRRLSTLLNDLAVYEVPFTLIAFPKMIHNPEYLWRRLYAAIPKWIPAYHKFVSIHQQVAKPELVHTYRRAK